MGLTKIEYVDRVWNLVPGCKQNCFYCYAKAENDRRKYEKGTKILRKGWIENFHEPQFFPERIVAPYKVKKPQIWLVESMGDLFGNWVKSSIIKDALKVMKDNLQHTFLLLTKNPIRYLDFAGKIRELENVWVGVTAVNNKEIEEKVIPLGILADLKRIWLSIEPLMDENIVIPKWVKWVVLGAMTGRYAKQYPVTFGIIKRIINQCKILKIPLFIKKNLDLKVPLLWDLDFEPQIHPLEIQLKHHLRGL